MPWRHQADPTVVEKVIGGLCYFTFGIIGLIYVLFFNKGGLQSTSELFRFHFIQSILLGFFAMLVGWMFPPAFELLNGLLGAVIAPALPVLMYVIGIVQKAWFFLLVYGAVLAFLGKFAEVPVISNVVRQNMMR
jgi:uncharacterized membrane protein